MIKGTKKIVTKMLTEHPELRDNDNKLLANIYWQRVADLLMYEVSEEEMSGIKKFLGYLSKGSLPNFESIRRCRQKIQEEEPELRGHLWDKRHEVSLEVKEELKLW
jgi:hypothetical protein|tara:strand:- start:587 stop:904 length:318 start_codon:yes stop_codon:yes gene_type:complete